MIGEGVPELKQGIDEFIFKQKSNRAFVARRRDGLIWYLKQRLRERCLEDFEEKLSEYEDEFLEVSQSVSKGEESPFSLLDSLCDKLFSSQASKTKPS